MRPVPSKRLSKQALPLWRWQALFESLFYALAPIGYGVCIYFFSWPQWILYLLIAILAVYAITIIFIVPAIRWRRWRYDVLEHEIDLQHGVFIVTRTLIPMTRVQHVDTEQGPLLRRFKMATVSISTAATVHKIPALTLEVADSLRDRIAELAAVAEDE